MEIRLQAPSELKYRMRQIYVISSQVASEAFLCFKVWQIPISCNNKRNVYLSFGPNPALCQRLPAVLILTTNIIILNWDFISLLSCHLGYTGCVAQSRAASTASSSHVGSSPPWHHQWREGITGLTQDSPTVSAAGFPVLKAKTLSMHKQFMPLTTSVSSQ